MDERERDFELKLLQEKVKGLDESRKDYINRIMSHLESETRHRELLGEKVSASETNIDKRLNFIETVVKSNKDELVEIRKALYNTGTGLMFRVRDIETKVAHGDSILQKWAIVVSVIISALALYFSIK